MITQTVSIETLHADPRNAREHGEKSIDALVASLRQFGQVEPLVVQAATGKVIGGNGRLQALRAIGAKEVDVVMVDADEHRAAALGVVLNRSAELSTWNAAELSAVLDGIGDLDMAQFGLDAQTVEAMLEPKYETRWIRVETLKPHPRNYQSHPEAQLAQIVASIQTHGFYRNIVVAQNDTVLAGHGVVAAAKAMGKKLVPTIYLDIDPDSPRALKVVTSDNEISNLAETDDRALTELLKHIMETDGLAGTGFNEQQLAALAYTSRPKSEVNDKNAAADWAGMPEYEAPENPFKLIVNIATKEEVEVFLKLIGNPGPIPETTNQLPSIWYPHRERRDLASLKFTAGDARLPEESEPAPPQVDAADRCETCGRELVGEACAVCDDEREPDQ